MIGEPEVERVLAVLRDDISQMPKNWNRRFKHNRDKMKTGDIFELAEVVRNLAIRDFQKGLSTGEKQMFTRAKKILASELMYALDMDENEAEEYLDDLLEETNTSAPPRRNSSGSGRRLCALRRGHRGDGARNRGSGTGERLARATPKALVELAGRPMAWWPPRSRAAASGVRMPWSRPRRAPSTAEVARPIGGAVSLRSRSSPEATRSDSVAAGASRRPGEAEVVVVHDAAAPW